MSGVVMSRFAASAVVTCMVVSSSVALAPGAAADPAAMSDGALRKAIAGRTVLLATPMGSLPINYRSNGTMFGSVNLILSGYTGSKKDTGRWWVSGNQLCQRWSKWLEGQSYCYTMRKVGGSKVVWNRSDGRSGTATITP